MHNDVDSLLFVISAKGNVTWPSFKEIFDCLYSRRIHCENIDLDNLPRLRRETIRALDALGHCDISFDKGDSRIFVAPAILARLPQVGLPKAVLAGARSPTTVKELSELCKIFGGHVRLEVREQNCNYALIPFRIVVEAESPSQLSEISAALGFKFAEEPPAWSLSHFVGSLDDYLSTRQWSAMPDLNWKRKDFDLSCLQFRSSVREREAVHLSSYIDRVTSVQTHILWKNESCAPVDRDWGRYAALREGGTQVLLYDEMQFLIAVPASTPLPRLFARALALCSGFAPTFVAREGMPYTSPETWGFNIFQDVPPQIAELVAAKLGQTLQPSSLSMSVYKEVER